MGSYKRLIGKTKLMTILFIEDESMIRDSVGEILKILFKEVFLAVDGEEGFNLYKNKRPDLVLTDIQMPKKSGLQLSEEIKKINKYQYIILLSAFNDSKYLMQSIKYGVNDFLMKPFDEHQFAEAIQNYFVYYDKHREIIESKKVSAQQEKDYELSSLESKNQVVKIEYENYANEGDIPHPITLIQSIKSAPTIKEVAELRSKTNELIEKLFDFDGNASSLITFACEIKDKVSMRLIELSLKEMEKEGLGKPPCSFTWIGMGSEGRKSQTFHSDQDNGLIFENVSSHQLESATDWFSKFSKKVVDGLAECGFPLCDGKIMATNPKLCQPLDGWKELFKEIIEKHDEESLLFASIYFDFRYIWGDNKLSEQLWDFLIDEVKGKISFFRSFADAILLASRPPIKNVKWKMYHHFKTKAPELNIKREAVAPLDAAIRLLSLANGVKKTSTLERLVDLREKEVIDKDLADSVQSAFHFITLLRVKHEANKKMDELNDYVIKISSLNPLDAEFLVDSLMTIYNLQDYTFQKVGGIKQWGF